MTGHATKEAAEHVRAILAEVLAETLGCDPATITFVDGIVKFNGQSGNFEKIRTMYIKEHRGWTDPPSGEYLTFREAARLAFLSRGTVVGTGKYKPPRLGGSYKGAAVGTSPAYGCSAQVVEVSVDLETGEVTVEAMTDAHDCGLAVNKAQVEGQMQGSLSMGLGECLFEEVKFDSRGRIVNASLGEYRIPTALDMPNVKTIIVESREPNGPYGAKEVGEGAIMPTIPAILNAIYDATGVRVNELPVSSERLYMALRKKQEGA
jgi:CO/xanthine dehydrogenase Mo-binding subunit